MAAIFCQRCRSPLDPRGSVCTQCGLRFTQAGQQNQYSQNPYYQGNDPAAQQHIAQLQQHEQAIQQRLAQLQQHEQAMQQRLAQLQQHEQATQQHLAQLQQEVQVMQQRIGPLQQNELVLQQTLAPLQQQVNEYQNRLKQMETQDIAIRQRIAQVGQLQEEEAGVVRRLHALKEEWTSETARIAPLKNEIASLQMAISQLRQQSSQLEQYNAQLQAQADSMAKVVPNGPEYLKSLKREIEQCEDIVEIRKFGFYHTTYGLESSNAYNERLQKVREQQKTMIKEWKATYCEHEITYEGSVAKGKEFMKDYQRLILRAFNGECDAAISTVTYSNIVNLTKRLEKSFETINNFGKVHSIFIAKEYFELKISELKLMHEYREKVQEEKEEQKRIKEQMREEQRAQKEIEAAQAKAEKEEAQRQAALQKAREELAKAHAAQMAALQAQTEERRVQTEEQRQQAEEQRRQAEKLEHLVGKLETELSDAIDRKAKAIARAQLTKSGHVYVLSNIGSFGEGVYKIGMTRRLEPLERVDELGDASVPFKFDVHAMIYSENAPQLEAALHERFKDRRINKINMRKEYFQVSLEEIQHAVSELFGTVTFVTEPNAEEYWKTKSLENEMNQQP